MRISDWSSDVCSSDLLAERLLREFHSLSRIWSQSPEALSRILGADSAVATLLIGARDMMVEGMRGDLRAKVIDPFDRSEEHTSELQSLMRISYAVFCLKKKNIITNHLSI